MRRVRSERLDSLFSLVVNSLYSMPAVSISTSRSSMHFRREIGEETSLEALGSEVEMATGYRDRQSSQCTFSLA